MTKKLYQILESGAHLGGHGWIQTNEVEAKSGTAAIREHRASQRRRGNESFRGTKFKAVLVRNKNPKKGTQSAKFGTWYKHPEGGMVRVRNVAGKIVVDIKK